MSANDPILSSGTFQKLNPFASRPTVEPGVSLVVSSDKGDVLALMPGQRLTAGDIAWKKYTHYYKVDIGTHNLEFQTKVPCNKDAFNFEAKLQVVYQVDDPTLIVKNNTRDVLTILKPEIENRMRTISRRYNAEQSEEAEQEINKSLGKGVRIGGIFAKQIISNLELEPTAREHLRTLQNTKNEIARKEAEHELQITISKHEFEIKKLKMDFYAPLIKKGQWNLLALQLAEHPDDVAAIASMINQHQQAELDKQLKMLKIMLEEDVVEGFQVEEVGKRVLQRLVDSLGPITSKALTDGGSKGNSDKPVGKKHKKKSSKENTENIEDTNEEDE